MQMHCDLAVFGSYTCTEVKWAGKDQRWPTRPDPTRPPPRKLKSMLFVFGMSVPNGSHLPSCCQILIAVVYLDQRLDAGLEDHVGVEQEGA